MDDGDVKAENVTFTSENTITSTLGDITLGIPEKTLADLSVEQKQVRSIFQKNLVKS